MCWPPWASIERTDHILVICAQETVVACSSTDVWLKRTASMIVFKRETDAGPVDHSAGLRAGAGSTFFKSSESIQLCWVSVKGCHVQGLPAESVCGPVQEAYMLCISGFPERVYINSNRRDSWI
jgi:hypothetical protein